MNDGEKAYWQSRREFSRLVHAARHFAPAVLLATPTESAIFARALDALNEAAAWAGVLATEPTPGVETLEPRQATRGALVATATMLELRGEARLWRLRWQTFQQEHEQTIWTGDGGKAFAPLAPFPTKLRLAAERWRVVAR